MNLDDVEKRIATVAHRIADLPLGLVGEPAEMVIRDILRGCFGDLTAELAVEERSEYKPEGRDGRLADSPRPALGD